MINGKSNLNYVLGNKIEECPCYAGLDEQSFYNAKYEMIPDTFTGNNFTSYSLFHFVCFEWLFFIGVLSFFFSQDIEDMSSNSCSGSTLSTLQYRNGPQINFPPPPMQASSAYECYANVIVPKRRVPFENSAPGSLNGYHNELIHESLPIEYPQPEYYDQYVDHYGRRQSVSLPCYECIEMQNMPVYYAPSKVHDEYDIYSQRRNLDRFGLSKKGLLQIDYSLSWMNLQRLISSK